MHNLLKLRMGKIVLLIELLIHKYLSALNFANCPEGKIPTFLHMKKVNNIQQMK